MPKKTHSDLSWRSSASGELPALSQGFILAFLAITCDEAVRDLRSCSVRQPHQRRKPIVGRFASATPALCAAECATARRETRRNRLPAIASASLWLPYPAFPPTSSTRPARLRQKDLAVSATSVPALALADEWAALHRSAMLLPDYIQISQHPVPLSPVFDSDCAPLRCPGHHECASTAKRDRALPSVVSTFPWSWVEHPLAPVIA